MRLALALGRVDWRAMLREISPQEFFEWMAFERVEPFGREWHRTSAMAAGICNDIRYIAGALGGEKDRFLEEDAFVPWTGIEKQKRENKRALDALNSMIGF